MLPLTPILTGAALISFTLAALGGSSLAAVKIAPAPAGEPLSTRFKVSVDKHDSPVYIAAVRCIDQVGSRLHPEAQLDGQAAFTSFDMGNAPVTVVVTCAMPIAAATLLPSSYGLQGSVSGNSVTFVVKKPGQITVEINGDWNNSLHIFANPSETDIPRPDDPNVIYFAPGVHQIEPVNLPQGKTVYVAAGAVIYGKLSSSGKGPIFELRSNCTLRGRGIIDGSLIPKPSPMGDIVQANGTDIRVEGVIMRDSGGWTFPIQDCQRVKVDNIKIFGWRGNSDGIDINSSSSVAVNDCFFRTFDDNVVIKASRSDLPPTRDVTVQRCISWNEIAHPFSLGAELNNDCENITFSDCDIIHDKGREWLLRVYNSGAGHARNVVFDNIRIEEARRPISLWIGSSIWVKGTERGHIDDVTFSNITCPAPSKGHRFAEFTGFDPDHAIHNVTFKNVTVAGYPVSVTDIKQNDFVSDVKLAE